MSAIYPIFQHAYFVNDVEGHLPVGHFKGVAGIECRQDDHKFFAIDHGLSAPRSIKRVGSAAKLFLQTSCSHHAGLAVSATGIMAGALLLFDDVICGLQTVGHHLEQVHGEIGNVLQQR